jgi:hypothetical protein
MIGIHLMGRQEDVEVRRQFNMGADLLSDMRADCSSTDFDNEPQKAANTLKRWLLFRVC